MNHVSSVIYADNKQKIQHTATKVIEKEVTITYVSNTEPDDQIEKGAIWIDTSKNPPHIKVYIDNQWQEAETLNQYVIAQDDKPSDPYDGLLWYNTHNKQLMIYLDGQWQPVSTGGVSSSSPIAITYKSDNKTIKIDNTNTIHVLFNNDEKDQPGYVWDNKRIQKEAMIKALIFG